MSISGFHRRLQIEDLEARIALMPLFQAEKDRRYDHWPGLGGYRPECPSLQGFTCIQDSGYSACMNCQLHPGAHRASITFEEGQRLDLVESPEGRVGRLPGGRGIGAGAGDRVGICQGE